MRSLLYRDVLVVPLGRRSGFDPVSRRGWMVGAFLPCGRWLPTTYLPHQSNFSEIFGLRLVHQDISGGRSHGSFCLFAVRLKLLLLHACTARTSDSCGWLSALVATPRHPCIRIVIGRRDIRPCSSWPLFFVLFCVLDTCELASHTMSSQRMPHKMLHHVYQ